MEIKTLKDMYVMVGRNDYPDYTSVRCQKKECIAAFLKDSTVTWAEARKRGWRCVKVDVIFNDKSGYTPITDNTLNTPPDSGSAY